MSETTPAGWYPAPHAGNELRYWDGTSWHAAPAYLPAGTSAAPGIPSPAPAAPVLPPYASGAPGMPPGYPPYSGGPVPRPRSVGLGVTALSLGIAAFVLGWIPFLGFVVAIAGAVFGVIALVRRQPKPLALTGTILSGVALVVACLATFSILSLIWSDTTDDYSYNSEQDYGSDSNDAPAVPELEPYAPATGPGSLTDPLPLPYVHETGSRTEYSAEVRIVDEDATDEVRSWNSLNPAASDGYRYVLVEMTVASLDPDGLPAAFPTYDLSLATDDGGVYPYSFVVAPDDSTLLRDAGTIAEGDTATGLVAYLVPDDATDFLLTDLAGYYAF
ncbi:DUF2510 domain-containing protein [Microbacterium sp. NPDC091382]|uniref:DUF2510 domain-containing protein n=1 Tax=Microbacterium sp. NPDC091382 TaxID=3364210 RepID=UPI00382DC838